MKRAVLLTLALGLGCGHQAEQASDPVAALSVGVRRVERDSLSETIALSGRLTPMPGRNAMLTAPADAIVGEVAVTIGQPVQRGQLLLRLEAPELTTNARSMAAQARSDSLDLDRQRGLFQQGITSRRRLEEREAAATSSRAQSEAALQLLNRTAVSTPISGGIQRLLTQVGERVTAGQALVEVVNNDGLDFHAGVPAASLSRIRLGQTVQVTPDGAATPLAGLVYAVAPAIDSMTGLGEVVVRLSQVRGVRAGGGATGSVQLQLLREAVIVSDSAVVPADRGLQVFVVGRDSIARARSVTVLARSGSRVAVEGALRPGDLIAVNGAYGLTDSTRVVPVPAP